MEYKDYYKTLGISKTDSDEEVKKAFRRMARKHHPDVNPGDTEAEERFKDINEAYQVLSDPEKRQKYDQFGAQWQQYSRYGGQPEDFNWSQWAGKPSGGYTQKVSSEEFEQMFGGGLGGFSDFFETLFGGFGRQSPRTDNAWKVNAQSNRKDQIVEVNISLNEAFTGTQRLIQWQSGKKIEAKIPPGVKDGSKVRLRGLGGRDAMTGRESHIYLKVNIANHKVFTRVGDNLKQDLSVPLYSLILGGEEDVPTLSGKISLTIPKGTANGQTIRLKGLGMPKIKNPSTYGDMHVKVNAVLPEKLTEEEVQLFNRLKDIRSG